MEEKGKRKPGGGRKPLPDKDKKVQVRFSIKAKNEKKLVKRVLPIIKELDQ
jgi:hypothetical protein